MHPGSAGIASNAITVDFVLSALDDIFPQTRQVTAGDDLISGLGGHDLIDAGAGNDAVYGGEGHHILYGGEGSNAGGGTGNDRVYANSTLRLPEVLNLMAGGAGDDLLIFTGFSHATMYGVGGNDSRSAELFSGTAAPLGYHFGSGDDRRGLTIGFDVDARKSTAANVIMGQKADRIDLIENGQTLRAKTVAHVEGFKACDMTVFGHSVSLLGGSAADRLVAPCRRRADCGGRG